MNIEIGSRVVITTNNWFYAPDGKEYRGVFGTVKAVCSDEQTLGIKTNRNATNWYAVVGNMTIAGCQICYVIRADKAPPDEVDSWHTHEGVTKISKRPTTIYNADGSP